MNVLRRSSSALAPVVARSAARLTVAPNARRAAARVTSATAATPLLALSFHRAMSTSSSSAAAASAAAQQASVPAPVTPSPNAGRPSNVGIHAMDMYFPRRFVAQSDLETHNGVASGKYTIGLGQTNMAFCTDREDIYSVCLSAVDRFMRVNNIPYSWIGRVEVATETILDHSKSIKTHLMDLFGDNTDVEGIDSMNACYAGTNALLNSTAWVESSAWDGRYALVVSADIAEYASGPARPTGGCGAVVMLVGPNAPIVLEAARASHMENAWDFYKPHLTSPYPVVDGKFSNSCYLRALDDCFSKFASKFATREGRAFSVLRDADHALFHAPYNKLVQKSYARLLYNESLLHPEEESLKSLAPFASVPKDKSYEDVALEKAAVAVSKEGYATKVAPSTKIPQMLGNMYTASLYAGLMSLINDQRAQLEGKRLLMFSYGSGLAATLFSLKVGQGEAVRAQLQRMAEKADIDSRLAARTKSDPVQFNDWMARREALHLVEGAFSLTGATEQEDLFPGAFYLAQRDADGKRKYIQTAQ